MPTYEYECGNCHAKLEKFQSMKDEPLKQCPSCGKNTLKRLIGAGGGIIFKGNGFYCTDYRSESYTKAKKQETGASAAVKTESKDKSGSKKAEKNN